MASLDTLINKVVEDAKAEGKAKYEAAQAEQAQEISEFEQKLEQQATKEKETIEKHYKNIVEREKQSATNKMKIKQLSQKQDFFSDVYAKAIETLTSLSEEEFTQLVRAALQQLPTTENTRLKLGEYSKDQLSGKSLQALQAEFSGLSFDEETVRGDGGFVLEQEKVDYNFIFGRLINENKDELSRELTSRAFS